MRDEQVSRLSRGWDEAAEGYERYFVPRFAPWLETALNGLPRELPGGPVGVPCCGTFPELPPLAEAYPDREIVGVDLSPGMLEHARLRADGYRLARVVCGDASDLTSVGLGDAGAVVSAFGLQQLPDPIDAATNWVRALRPGGWLSVVFWPLVTENVGPFALLDSVVDEALDPVPKPTWPEQLTDAVAGTGARVVRDQAVSHPMSHPDAETFWSAMTEGGPLRSFVLARDEEFIDSLRARFLARAPTGIWDHRPTARWILAQRE